MTGLRAAILLCVVILTACKKDSDESDTGGMKMPPVSLLSPETSAETAATIALAPPGAARGLSVPLTATATAAAPAMPEMINVPGTDTRVRISARMKNTAGWHQQFATAFQAVHDCLSQVDQGAAYVTAASPLHNGFVIDLYGLDQQAYRCTVSQTAPTTLSPRAEDTHAALPSVLYFPRSAGAPVLERPDCYDVEPLVARPQGLIGWMAFIRAACRL